MIKHVTQPSALTCVQACWAMVSDLPIENIIKEMGDKGLSCSDEYELALKTGIFFNQCTWPNLMPNFYHLVTVPSLNLVGVNHRIVLYYDEPKAKMVVFDPNVGRQGVKAYTSENLKSWSEVWIVIPENDEH
jgi:hypothetical protein